MIFNKHVCLFLMSGLLLGACANEPSESKESLSEISTEEVLDKNPLAEAKVDAIIATNTPSEIELAESKTEEARLAKEKAAEEAQAAADKKEKADKLKAKKDKERRARKRKREKERRERKELAAKRAKEQKEGASAAGVQTKSDVVDYNQSPVISSTKRSSGKPVVEFYKMTHNYGKIEQGDKIEYKFKFKNTGTSELVVNDASATCGCTKPSFPFIPIGPGEEGYIGVIFDSKGKLGRQKPAVTINTNADPASYKLYLEGFVNSPEKKDEEDKIDEGKK